MENKRIKNSNDLNRSMIFQEKPNKISIECKICGAPAFYSYVSVMVCSSCKMFFKRNAEPKQKHLKCYFNDNCEINILNRHICSSCRLAKCFQSGMQIEMLRSSGATKNKQQKIIKQLRTHQSTFTLHDWNMMSNLTHCYDEFKSFALVQNFIHNQNYLPPKMRYKYALVNQLILSLIDQSNIFFQNNSHFISLCLHDRSILLHNTMKYIGCFSAYFIISHTDLLKNLNQFKSSEIFYESNALVTFIRTANHFDIDSTFLKLALGMIVFSTFDYTNYKNRIPNNLVDIRTILHIQNIYTELAWQYLICKYNHKQAVIYMSSFIRCLLLLNNVIIESFDTKQGKEINDLSLQQTEEL